jgi:MFS family permease
VKRLAAARHPEAIAAALAIAQAIGFAWASVVAEGNGSPVTFIMALVRGLFMGYALAFGLIMTAHTVPRIAAKRARWVGWGAFGGLLLISPAIIAPAIQHAIPADVLTAPAARWLWAITIAAAPDLVAIGIAVAGKLEQVGNVAQTVTTKKQPSATTAKPITDELLRIAIRNNPNATQSQLGAMFSPPVSGAAVGKRIRKIKT